MTLNRGDEIDPAKAIRRSSTTIPSTPREGVAAQARQAEISGGRRTHYCGAYWGWGFHEDGVVSAQRVCDEIASKPAPPPGVSDFMPHIGRQKSDTSGEGAMAA